MLENLHVPDDIKMQILDVIDILKQEGCTEIYVFGSIAEDRFTANSDIDIAVDNLSKDRFFKVYGELLGVVSQNIDFVVLNYDNSFTRILKEHGTFKRVA